MNSLPPATSATAATTTTINTTNVVAATCYPIDFGDNDQVVLTLLQAGALSRIVGDSYHLGQTFSPRGSGTQNRDVVASLGSTFGTAMKRLALGLIQNDTKTTTTTTTPSIPPPSPSNPPTPAMKSKSHVTPKLHPNPKPKPTRTLVHYGAQDGVADIQF